MKLVILTNDNYFSFSVLKDFLKFRKNDIKLIVFSSALIGKRRTRASVMWSFKNTGLRQTIFKLLVYGVFKVMRMICKILPVIPNNYSSLLWAQRNQIKHIFSRKRSRFRFLISLTIFKELSRIIKRRNRKFFRNSLGHFLLYYLESSFVLGHC